MPRQRQARSPHMGGVWCGPVGKASKFPAFGNLSPGRTVLVNWELADDGLELTTGSFTCLKQACLTSGMGGSTKSHVFLAWSWKWLC